MKTRSRVLVVMLAIVFTGGPVAQASHTLTITSPPNGFTTFPSTDLICKGTGSWTWLFDTPISNVMLTLMDGSGHIINKLAVCDVGNWSTDWGATINTGTSFTISMDGLDYNLNLYAESMDSNYSYIIDPPDWYDVVVGRMSP